MGVTSQRGQRAFEFQRLFTEAIIIIYYIYPGDTRTHATRSLRFELPSNHSSELVYVSVYRRDLHRACRQGSALLLGLPRRLILRRGLLTGGAQQLQRRAWLTRARDG